MNMNTNYAFNNGAFNLNRYVNENYKSNIPIKEERKNSTSSKSPNDSFSYSGKDTATSSLLSSNLDENSLNELKFQKELLMSSGIISDNIQNIINKEREKAPQNENMNIINKKEEEVSKNEDKNSNEKNKNDKSDNKSLDNLNDFYLSKRGKLGIQNYPSNEEMNYNLLDFYYCHKQYFNCKNPVYIGFQGENNYYKGNPLLLQNNYKK